MTTLSIVVVVIVIMSALEGMAMSLQQNTKKFSCILVFGDSSVDPGNNNHLNTSFKANFPPYGKNLFHGQCSGRFTNGKLPTDMTGTLLDFLPLTLIH